MAREFHLQKHVDYIKSLDKVSSCAIYSPDCNMFDMCVRLLLLDPKAAE